MSMRGYRSASLVITSLCFLTALPFQAESAGAVAPETGLLSRQAIVFNPTLHKVYAVDPAASAVTVIEAATHHTRSIPVGLRPLAIALNPKTNRVYVANTGSGTVSVLDGDTDRVVATVNVGKSPYVLAANPVENKIYVSNTFSNLLTVIDGASDATAKTKTGSADAILIDATQDRAYLLGYESTSLTVLRGSDNTLTKLPAGEMHLWGMALDERAGTLYVSRIGSADVAVLHTGQSDLQAVKTGALPCAIAINRRSRTAYVANWGDDTVTVIDEQTNRATKNLHVGSRPQAVAVDEKNNLIYVANTHADSVTVIDGNSNQIRTTLPAGKNPYAIAVDPDGRAAYVANLGDRSFTRVTPP